MKKTVVLFVLILSLLALTGCLDQRDQAQNEPAVNKNINPDASRPANANTGVQKFYPDSPSINKSEQPPAGSDFVVTQELQVKFFLVDKYNQGICYGQPSPVPAAAVAGLIEKNPDLAKLIKSHYNLKTDLEVYNKIKQLNGIQLVELAGGKYRFDFTDGQCCVLKAYEGEVTVVGQTISDTIIRTETKQNPC